MRRIDVGIGQALLGYEMQQVLIEPFQAAVNRDSLIDALVAQEFVAYAACFIDERMCYWQSNNPKLPYHPYETFFSTQNYCSEVTNMHPLYAIAPIAVQHNKELASALKALHEP